MIGIKPTNSDYCGEGFMIAVSRRTSSKPSGTFIAYYIDEEDRGAQPNLRRSFLLGPKISIQGGVIFAGHAGNPRLIGCIAGHRLC